MRTEQDIHSQRHQTISESWNQFHVDLARITISVARKIYEKDGNLSVKVPGKRFIQEINWKEVNLDDDEFVLQIYPVSKLPNDPEGRLATIQEMMEAGLIDQQTGRRLLDFPDLDAEENLANAVTDYLHKILDEIVEDGKFTPPEPFDDLEKALTLAQEYYAQGKLNNLPERRLELLRKFMKQVKILNPPAPTPVLPQANPMPKPTSDLVPNVNGAVAA